MRIVLLRMGYHQCWVVNRARASKTPQHASYAFQDNTYMMARPIKSQTLVIGNATRCLVVYMTRRSCKHVVLQDAHVYAQKQTSNYI